MITNERQYRITRAEVEKFEQALAGTDTQKSALHPRLQQAMREGMKSQLQDLREELAQYEALREGRIRMREITSLVQLPDILIQVRVAAGLTQEALTERLGVSKQPVQRDEATRYARVS